jgi:hypothetical protein
MGTELVPETLYSNELTRLCAREDYIESCRRESFKTYMTIFDFKDKGVLAKGYFFREREKKSIHN